MEEYDHVREHDEIFYDIYTEFYKDDLSGNHDDGIFNFVDEALEEKVFENQAQVQDVVQ